MTTTPSDGNAEQATASTTNYAAGLGAVAAYTGNNTVAPNPTDAAEGSTSKYTAGNQVQSA